MDEEFKKTLIDLAEKKGLSMGEEALEELLDFSFEVISLVVEKSENKYDDMIWGAVKGKAKEYLAKVINKVDGNPED
jgi:hypothetical protein